MCSMQMGGCRLTGRGGRCKQAGGRAHKALWGVDLLGEHIAQGLAVGAALEDGLDRAVVRAVVGQRAGTGRLQAHGTIGLGQVNDALGRAQPLDDAVAQQALQQLRAGRPDVLGLLGQPLPVMGEEQLRLGWQVVAHRHALTWAQTAGV